MKVTDKIQVFKGDCIEVLKTLEENSVDSVVTDPPYEIGFMGKSWDASGIANNPEMWKECLRVLKPGGYLLSFSATRTYHRMAVGIEDAGFEIRDMIEWVYGSGFPKSHAIGKAVDKLQGNKREDLGWQSAHINRPQTENWNKSATEMNHGKFKIKGKQGGGLQHITKGTSEYEGWGTALKPAHEPICMARKPLAEKTVAENCLKWGTGGINIDESRVEGELTYASGKPSMTKQNGWNDNNMTSLPERTVSGRFPANLIHDNSEEVRACFPETKPSKPDYRNEPSSTGKSGIYGKGYKRQPSILNDSGNASRFFKSIIYQSKPSKKERNAGCERNGHPTIKPIALMEHLIKMVTKEGGVVLDPFMGSGTTGVACKNTNRKGIGIEMNEEYFQLAIERIKNNVSQQKLF